MHRPTSLEELQDAVRTLDRVIVRGSGTKSAMSSDANLSTAELRGILEYDPSEFTFTARAGTRISEVKELLAKSGQYLPFDPPFVQAGGTLGGTIAAGISGPGRFRYGGVRDFLLGIRFVTGDGEIHAGGGKVVKNAAGFDSPKLMTGARGAFGVIGEVTFKVFPEPREYQTVIVSFPTPDEAIPMMARLAMSNFELACLDFVMPGQLQLRVGGLHESLGRRVDRIKGFVGRTSEVRSGSDDEQIWQDAREFAWVPGDATLIKIAINPRQIVEIERSLEKGAASHVKRRYSVGGNVLWLAWPNEKTSEKLSRLLMSWNLPGVAVRGEPWGILGPHNKGDAFQQRLTSVFDPSSKFQRNDRQTANSH
jgi:glycolate oxidase FAD binding subunit